ncbi:MAG: AMP-binding protein [Gammaproteobacteria bacterium]|nr:AMP-binding protein [Gammaproteobacteria bacterium]
MDRYWLKSYPASVPAEIDPREFSSLKHMIETSCERFADRPAFLLMNHALRYREIERLSAAFGAWLQQVAGLRKGERVAIMLPNVLQYPVAMFGALRAGMVVVNVNPLYTADELAHQLSDSGASTIVVLENFAATLQQALPRSTVKHVIVTGVGDLLPFPKGSIVNFVLRHVQRKVPAWRIAGTHGMRGVLRAGAALQLAPVQLDHDDLAYLQYTGGTTGIAKGAMLTHGNMVANVLQCRAWFRQIALDNTTYVCALPLYHIFSLTVNCLLFSSLGGCGLLIPNPRDFAGFVKELRAHPPMFFAGVNTLYNALMNTTGFDTIDFSRLVGTMGGGMAVQRTVAERWRQKTGCHITQGWGLTEASPVGCANLLGPQAEFNGSIGLPLPATEISIRDDDGNDLGIGPAGEICLRGPQVMRGYWNRPDETAKVLMPGGWLRTGDIGHMDSSGFVFMDDRKKDMIVVSGFKVFPNEVEDVVAAHPGVLEVAAVAQPDERSGETVALFIVKKDPALTEEALLEYCRKHLTGYKQPRRIIFRNELPKTNVGKILRRALRDELAS